MSQQPEDKDGLRVEVNCRNQAIGALPVAKIENANSVRPFGDYSIHAIKYFTQVPKRAAIGQMFHHGQPSQKLSSNFGMHFGPFLDPASSHDPHTHKMSYYSFLCKPIWERTRSGLSLAIGSSQFPASASTRLTLESSASCSSCNHSGIENST
jgi:hypothetical protein